MFWLNIYGKRNANNIAILVRNKSLMGFVIFKTWYFSRMARMFLVLKCRGLCPLRYFRFSFWPLDFGFDKSQIEHMFIINLVDRDMSNLRFRVSLVTHVLAPLPLQAPSSLPLILFYWRKKCRLWWNIGSTTTRCWMVNLLKSLRYHENLKWWIYLFNIWYKNDFH